MRTPSTHRRGIAAVALAAVAALSLAACRNEPAAAPVAAQSPATALTVKDPWVKAVESGMTAAFGVLTNDSDTDVTVTAVTSNASPMELHEMAVQDGQMVMRPKAGGILVKAHGTHELEPGGDHLMLMQPSAPIKPGDRIAFTLTLADGRSVAFTAVAKPFAGAGESYAPGMHG
jgi:copper(I)-binding protein